jgi:hypothetical protein
MFRKGFVFLLLVITFMGCAGSKQGRNVEMSGFLGDYSMLTKGEKGQELLRYNNPKAKWASYKKIILDPVMIWRDSKIHENVPEEDLQRLSDYLYSLLYEELKKDYEMVNKPAPETLRMQVAIVSLEKSNPTLATISSVPAPYNVLALGSMVTNMVSGKPLFVGEATVEGKVTDALTGELLGAGVDRRVGGKGPSEEKLTSWGDVEHALQYWAKNSRYRLCMARGEKTQCQAPE